MEKGEDSSTFKMGNSAQERSLPFVPDCYVVPPSSKPCDSNSGIVPTIDVSRLKGGDDERRGIVNHGINQNILDDALEVANSFFELPAKEKKKFMSNDVYAPVRYSTSLKDGLDKIQFWRIFLKHYAHPLHRWIHLWPENPPGYREKMGKFCEEVRKLSIELMGAITESLGLGRDYLSSRMDENGMQVMTVNCYPPCPDPETALGLPPHSDYSCITLLLQNLDGLKIFDPMAHGGSGRWVGVPQVTGVLKVHIGDHVEVLSNGLYKSIVHKVTLNEEKTRISLASLHSLGMDDKMSVPRELVNDENPVRYKESSFNDFLDFLVKNDISQGDRFIDTLRIKD
ncbi:Non-hem dioxygenase N-terminal domain [Arabidopsis thaliana x Arabidopsis arenosa]|uniref:KUOX1 n=2 Tax=Arabidopsis TaxID=3701 RepID=A0A178UCB4_ARATH|nr:Non-hem dioxygenase N-terminal domain [Arabidopsis thaliana x Arabidopsis arenosa]OAO90797.1 KUOX1 [Arabidopsis thaliana]